MRFCKSCRGKRIRTFDPLLPKQERPLFPHYQALSVLFKYFFIKYLRISAFMPIFAMFYKRACKLRANFAHATPVKQNRNLLIIKCL